MLEQMTGVHEISELLHTPGVLLQPVQAGEKPQISSVAGWAERPVNVCTSTMAKIDLDNSVELAADAGYQGVELRIHDDYHVSLHDLQDQWRQIKGRIEAQRLELKVYNAYYGVNNVEAVDKLMCICQRSGVRYFRVTLPVAGRASVRTRAFEGAVVPSYEHRAKPAEILRSAKASLQSLAKRTKAAGVCALVEIHWGTVMSSFSSAHYLVNDLDPEAVAVTLDPANMVIEGKEDWEYGIHLLREQVANVHIKNVSWQKEGSTWRWRWDSLRQGMVDWRQILALLADAGYTGMLAVEDFRVPGNVDRARVHLQELREETRRLLRQSEARRAA